MTLKVIAGRDFAYMVLQVYYVNTGAYANPSVLFLFFVLFLLLLELIPPALFLFRHGYRERKMLPILNLEIISLDVVEANFTPDTYLFSNTLQAISNALHSVAAQDQAQGRIATMAQLPHQFGAFHSAHWLSVIEPLYHPSCMLRRTGQCGIRLAGVRLYRKMTITPWLWRPSARSETRHIAGE